MISTILKYLPSNAEIEGGYNFNTSGELVYGERISIPTMDSSTGEYAGHYTICYVWDSDPKL